MTTRIVYADGPCSARVSPGEVLAAVGGDGPVDVLLGWTIERHAWIDDPEFRGSTVLAGYGLGRAVNEGRVTPLPVRLSAVAPMLIADPPEIGVIAAVRRGADLAFGGAVGWGDVLARVARQVVVEVDEDGVDLGGPTCRGQHRRPVATAARRPPGDRIAAGRRRRPADRGTGRLVGARSRNPPVRAGRDR